MKILWMADSPTIPTGFGNVSKWVCAGLAERGHDVSILGWQIQGQPAPWQNCMLHPCGFGADELLNHLHQIRPDILVVQADIWLLNYVNDSVIDFLHTADIAWALYYPIDGDLGEKRIPPSWQHILKTIDLPIAMSRYSCDVTQANGIEAACIPPGVDTNIFQPPVDKNLAKRSLSYEGKFVVLSDARNTLRKMWPRTLEIFRRFAADKDDVILHLHCDPDDPYACSPNYYYDLRSDIAFLNLTEKVSLTKDMSVFTGLSLEQLAQVYQAADVHLLASFGEGFGMPTLQAAATGVVPLAPDYTASQELVQGHGEAVSISHFLLNQFGQRYALIDIDDAVSKLEKLYRDRELLARKSQMAREFALFYDWKCILPQWDELLQREVSHRKTRYSSVHTYGIPLDEQESSSTLAPGDGKVDKLVAGLRQDMQLERAITIPVTLPLTKSKQRIPGYIYVASQCDVPAALALQRIFPGLKVWSTVQLDFGSLVSNNRPLQVKVVQANSAEYRPHLALSTLAFDLASFDPALPTEAAKLGVPCIGLAQQREQAQLWPELSLEKPDPLMAAELGRQMLTDQGVASELCLRARQHLAGALAPTTIGSSLDLSEK